MLAFNAAFTPGFFQLQVRDGHLYGSLIDVFRHAAPVCLIGLGMTLVIATRGVDVSVGATLAIGGTLAALMVTRANQGIVTTIAVVVAVSATLGFCNGAFVSVLGIQPIVATLVLMVSGRGIAQLLSNGQIITFQDPALSSFGGGYFLGLPLSAVVVAVCFGLILVLLKGTAIGLFVEAVGSNPEAARFSGVPVRSVLLLAYVLTAALAGIAGLIVAGETKAADANNAGLYIELDAILAVVLGGTPLTGGRIQLFGTLVGALLIQALTTTILTKGVQVEWTLVVKAAIVLGISLLQSDSIRSRLIRSELA